MSARTPGPVSDDGLTTAGKRVRFTFDQLVEAITREPVEVADQERLTLRVAARQVPFVKPTLLGEQDALEAEVLLIQAPAAVGKTSMARALSHACRAPLLDMAEVPVAVHALRGALDSDVVRPSPAVARYKAGDFAVVVDALDEGRLLQEPPFTAFLETAINLIQQDRTVTNRPKLVMIGRTASVADTSVVSEYEGVKASTLTLDYFDQESARELIVAYRNATAAKENKAPVSPHDGPLNQVIDAYFTAVAKALELDAADLWDSPLGRNFAGYAPMLATFGRFLAVHHNFKGIAGRLANSDARDAWEVIEEMAQEVMVRDRDQKVATKLRDPLPEAYDSAEQFELLAEWGQSGTVKRTARIGAVYKQAARQSDYRDYLTAVDGWLREHPFANPDRRGPDSAYANDVVAAMVLSRALVSDSLSPGSPETTLLSQAAKWPFLWRSLRTLLETGSDFTLQGRHLGYILASMMTDPFDDGVSVTGEGATLEFDIPEMDLNRVVRLSGPVHLYGQARRCKLTLDEEIVLHGVRRDHRAAIELRNVNLKAPVLRVESEVVGLAGTVWLGADELPPHGHVDLRVEDGAELGWGGVVGDRYPWNHWDPQLRTRPGDDAGADDPLVALFRAFDTRLPGHVVVHSSSYKIANDTTTWFDHQYGSGNMAALFRKMVQYDLVTVDSDWSTSGGRKYRLRFKTSGADLADAAMSAPSTSDELREFIEAARQIFDR